MWNIGKVFSCEVRWDCADFNSFHVKQGEQTVVSIKKIVEKSQIKSKSIFVLRKKREIMFLCADFLFFCIIYFAPIVTLFD